MASTQPDHETILARYQRAESLLLDSLDMAGSLDLDTKEKSVLNATVYPNWIQETECFWYVHETRDDTQFRLVNAVNASNDMAFDHRALATALGKASDETVNEKKLPINIADITLAPLTIRFNAFDKYWVFDAETNCCNEEKKNSPAHWTISPDGSKAVFLKHYNLWLCDLDSDEERALTDDGGPTYCYATTSAAYGRQEMITLEALWSPDSTRIITLVRDSRLVKVGPPLVRHVPPAEVGVRPDIIDPDRRVAFPDDEHVEAYHLLSIDVVSGERVDIDYPPCTVVFQHYYGFFSGGRSWWSPDSRKAIFTDCKRGGKVASLLEWDTDTGAVKKVIEETSNTRFKFIAIAHVGVLMKPLPGGKEVVWYSERSGWPHLYLYDLETGELKNTITEGPWVVRNILHYDADSRELIIATSGRVQGRNPYYRDLCRVNIDTSELTPLVSTDDEYFICDPIVRGSFGIKGVSPSGQYMVTTRSRVDTVPVSLLLDRQGNVVLELETADVSGLPEGWQWPEPVMLKAADGKTDTYGVVFKPSDFDPNKSYPILDASSFMSHTAVGAFSNSYAGNWPYFTPAAYAELGFIVVTIITRGTELRGSDFENDKDMALTYSFHQDDAVEGIQQLAERYPYMDINRVGLGGGYQNPPSTLNGMLCYPDFYKVGVSENAASDSRLLGDHVIEHAAAGRTWSDDQSEYHLEHYAKNLKGKLLLMAGMIDNTVPVASAFRMVEALQKANKDFDMLFMPNLGHGFSRYVMRRAMDFLVKHLQGIEPPIGFEFKRCFDIDDPTQYSFDSLSGIDNNF